MDSMDEESSDHSSTDTNKSLDESSSGNVNDDFSPPQKRLCRKRKREPHLHKKSIAKENVEKGRERITASGKVIPAKIFNAQTLCTCKLECATNIDVLRQEQIFRNYYDNFNHSQKTLLIRSCVTKVPVRKKSDVDRPLIPLKKRDFNFQYNLIDDNGVPKKVCRTFFLKCYQITNSSVNRAVKSAVTNPNAAERRGKASSSNRTSEIARNIVREFIGRFPAYESHYGRSSSQKKYLHMDLSIAEMHRMYKSKCDKEKISPVSPSIFREIFNNDFNLSFKKPHSDSCKVCDSYMAQISDVSLSAEEKEKLENLKRDHDALKKKIAYEFKDDVTNASENTVILTFDLQKVLQTPSLTTNVVFYKRQLATYNLCIYDETGRKAYMYIWSENVASRGGQEVASCLLKHLKNNIPESTDHVILYSDSCGGQNRNIKVTLMLKHFLASSNIDLIEQKFFLSWHSYNSCDRNFGYIEKERRKYETVNDPDHWIEIIKNTKKQEPKFDVTKMETNDFFTSQDLEELIVNRKKDVNRVKINWLLTRSIIHDREQPSDIFLKYDDEQLHRVCIRKKHITEEQFQNAELSLLSPNGNSITKQKYDDLMSLMEFVPKSCRQFYQTLRTNNSTEDYDYASGDSDEEE